MSWSLDHAPQTTEAIGSRRADVRTSRTAVAEPTLGEPLDRAEALRTNMEPSRQAEALRTTLSRGWRESPLNTNPALRPTRVARRSAILTGHLPQVQLD